MQGITLGNCNRALPLRTQKNLVPLKTSLTKNPIPNHSPSEGKDIKRNFSLQAHKHPNANGMEQNVISNLDKKRDFTSTYPARVLTTEIYIKNYNQENNIITLEVKKSEGNSSTHSLNLDKILNFNYSDAFKDTFTKDDQSILKFIKEIGGIENPNFSNTWRISKNYIKSCVKQKLPDPNGND